MRADARPVHIDAMIEALPRVPCIVPGCGRTHALKPEDTDRGWYCWICAKHWSMAPAYLKNARNKALRKRRYETAGKIWARAVRRVIDDVRMGL